MEPITVFIIIAFIASVVSLVMGLGSMRKGGDYDEEHSGDYMRARVISQAIAAFFILIALVSHWLYQ